MLLQLVVAEGAIGIAGLAQQKGRRVLSSLFPLVPTV